MTNVNVPFSKAFCSKEDSEEEPQLYDTSAVSLSLSFMQSYMCNIHIFQEAKTTISIPKLL